MSNHLSGESSPYLLEHADNPVDWYPWCDEAFCLAKNEDKPVFLSIGYSTCHWCHVMARESFMDDTVAALLNERFISIKVDREERPDLDSIYMSVCQAFTGGGGWPMSLFLTPDRKPFYAGTYYPKRSKHGMTGFIELLGLIAEQWEHNREALLQSADELIDQLRAQPVHHSQIDDSLIDTALEQYKRSYDHQYGGFGDAPKFPAPHNLLFLLSLAERTGNQDALYMAEHTLTQMYRGGLFDHIGYGFSRYSTDRRYLVPHFEKMLYDNALMILAYCKAYVVSEKPLYRSVAQQTADYVLCEMTSEEGGFYSAQDADSEGEEGKYYTFTPDEIKRVLGDQIGEQFNKRYHIDDRGNFEGKSIPNLLPDRMTDPTLDTALAKLYTYRKSRTQLHLDDKHLTAWNGLMIAALCRLYRISGSEDTLAHAIRAQHFIENRLRKQNTLFVSLRDDTLGKEGFLDDYACYAYALIELYEATLDQAYLKDARKMVEQAIQRFLDAENGGYYLYSHNSEPLILRPKETYDGAMPSGNGLMAYLLVRLSAITGDETFKALAKEQLAFLTDAAKPYPTSHAMFLIALLDQQEPPSQLTIVAKSEEEAHTLPLLLTPPAKETIIRINDRPTSEYPLLLDQTTFYLCENHSCLPPTNDWPYIKDAAKKPE